MRETGCAGEAGAVIREMRVADGPEVPDMMRGFHHSPALRLCRRLGCEENGCVDLIRELRG